MIGKNIALETRCISSKENLSPSSITRRELEQFFSVTNSKVLRKSTSFDFALFPTALVEISRLSGTKRNLDDLSEKKSSKAFLR